MSLLLNFNKAAKTANIHLNRHTADLQKSLTRLSSGNRIVSAADDAGGLAAAMRLSASASQVDVVSSNVSNAVSFVQSQDSALSSVADILTEMSSLRTKYDSATATSTDKAGYNITFQILRGQLSDLTTETFNGTSLFSGSNNTFGQAIQDSNGTFAVYTSENGASGSSVSIQKGALISALNVKGVGGTSNVTNATVSNDTALAATAYAGTNTSLGNFSSADITQAIANVATLRATSGAAESVLGFSQSYLAEKASLLSEAHDNIMAVDTAEESVVQSKLNILVQSATAALTQANTQAGTVLTLLDSIRSNSILK